MEGVTERTETKNKRERVLVTCVPAASKRLPILQACSTKNKRERELAAYTAGLFYVPRRETERPLRYGGVTERDRTETNNKRERELVTCVPAASKRLPIMQACSRSQEEKLRDHYDMEESD